MHSVLGAMRNEHEDIPKQPRPVSIGRKGENAVEAQEHGPSEVGPDGRKLDSRHHHMHVRC